jgi:hypothetical protein
VAFSDCFGPIQPASPRAQIDSSKPQSRALLTCCSLFGAENQVAHTAQAFDFFDYCHEFKNLRLSHADSTPLLIIATNSKRGFGNVQQSGDTEPGAR